jgi:ABC-type antimicrobial peptide transport system permease subunit
LLFGAFRHVDRTHRDWHCRTDYLDRELAAGIGVRLALGAQAHEVVSLIAIQGTRLITLGVGLGVLVSLLASRLLSSLLFGIAATDLRTLIVVAAGVLAFGVLASYVPARRAASLDPCTMFREE